VSWRDVPGVLLSIGIAVVAVFVSGEIAIRLYTRHAMIYDVEMTRYSNELKIASDNPLIGHVHRPGASSRLMGVRVDLNSDGFRDDEYPVGRSQRYRIIALGDSLTFGWGVPKDEIFETLIERELDSRRPTEIINFGTGNYNTEQEVNLFLEKGLKYDPDEVVIFYFINDAEPTPKTSPYAFLGHSQMVTFVWSRAKTIASRIRPSKSFQEYYSGLYREGSPGWERAKEAFAIAQRVCRENGIALKVVLLPELHRLEPYTFEAEHRLVVDFLDSLGIPALDLAPLFRGQGDPLRLWVALDDAHPNALAHRLIAQYAVDFVAPGVP
jgi:lysophospholipase L1-like esterase